MEPTRKGSVWEILSLANLSLAEVNQIKSRLDWLQRLVTSDHKGNGRRKRNLMR
jgi:hypothetical protein